MLTLSGAKLSEIEARLNVASPGPWKYDTGSSPLGDTGDYMSYALIQNGKGALIAHLEEPDDQQADRNGVFIAYAREDIETLLIEVKRLQEELRRRDS
jgi:hypothetical protein